MPVAEVDNVARALARPGGELEQVVVEEGAVLVQQHGGECGFRQADVSMWSHCVLAVYEARLHK